MNYSQDKNNKHFENMGRGSRGWGGGGVGGGVVRQSLIIWFL